MLHRTYQVFFQIIGNLFMDSLQRLGLPFLKKLKLFILKTLVNKSIDNFYRFLKTDLDQNFFSDSKFGQIFLINYTLGLACKWVCIVHILSFASHHFKRLLHCHFLSYLIHFGNH